MPEQKLTPPVTLGPTSKPTAGRRRALIVAMGSEDAIKSGRKIAELLGYTPHGYNFEVSSIYSRRGLDEKTPTANELYNSLKSVTAGMTGDDHLVVYLCLRKSKVNVDLHRILAPEGCTLKNLLVILDAEREYDFTDDCFRKLATGVVVLSMAGHDPNSTFRNGKYTYFSGLLIEALKGGAADEFGLITVANVFAYLQEATMMLPGVRPMLRSVMSESMLLRRMEGLLTDAELNTFCEAFVVRGATGQKEQKKDVLGTDEVDALPALSDLIPTLIRYQLLDRCYYMKPTGKKKRKGNIFLPFFSQPNEPVDPGLTKAEGYMLTAYGKHYRDMWFNNYFDYI